MPKSIQVARLSQPRRHLLLRPKCASLIGAIVGEWNTVENLLAHLHATALGTSRSSTDEEGEFLETKLNVTALLAMRKLSSNPSRIELMNKRVAPRLPPHLVSRWQQIVPLIEECARERNTVVHGDWWLSDLYPDGLILQDKQWQLTLYEVQCFEYVLECISTLSTALVKFAREVGKAQIG